MIQSNENEIRVSSGDSGQITFLFGQDLPAESGVIFSVARHPGGTLIIEKEAEVSGHEAAVKLSATDTDIAAGAYVYDIRVVNGDDVTTPILPSPFIVLPVVGDAEAGGAE